LLKKLGEVTAVGVDISEGMSREALAHASSVVADVASLPFPIADFDRVLTAHMLYRCGDITAASREMRRVLAPGGALPSVLNSVDHLAVVRALLSSVTGGNGLRIGLVAEQLDLEKPTHSPSSMSSSTMMTSPNFASFAPRADLRYERQQPRA